MQHADGRVIFVIPYQGQFTLIGTTEEEVKGSLDQTDISEQEIDYLINVTNQYFRQAISRSDIVHTFSGVRPLVEEAGKAMSQVSRGFKLEFEATPLPFLSVYGGKVTTYRLLAEKTLNKLARCFPKENQPWTKTAPLPGGDFDSRESLAQDITARYAWLGTELRDRWCGTYGTLVYKVLDKASELSDLGICFGHGLYQREVDYLCEQEWAQTAEDILWRRSKLGLLFGDTERELLENYMRQK